MIRYYITDRKSSGGEDALLRNVERLGDGIDLLQVREKDLHERALAGLVRKILRIAHPAVRVLVNGRLDIALATGAHGVHLPGDSFPVPAVRRVSPSSFTISVACHSVDDVREAERGGADLALLAPIYAVARKGPALGIAAVREAARTAHIRVLALGGVTQSRIGECMAAGAAGIAGIRLFRM